MHASWRRSWKIVLNVFKLACLTLRFVRFWFCMFSERYVVNSPLLSVCLKRVCNTHKQRIFSPESIYSTCWAGDLIEV